MADKPHLTSLKPMGEINLTPLMDLTFILLITFIITFPLIEHGIDIQVPEATAGDLSADTTRSISLDGDGNVYLDDQAIELDELRAALLQMGRLTPEVAVLVRADERLAYGRVVEVLRMLNEAKLRRTTLVTRAEER